MAPASEQVGDLPGFGDEGESLLGLRRPSLGSMLAGKKKGKKKAGTSCGFETLGLSLNVFRGVKRKGYQVPTPIQRKTLPLVLAGHDVVAMARTGSGKTAAFLIPMLERLRTHSPKGAARAIILSPTRELALQTDKFLRELGRYTDLRSACLVGGDSMEAQFEDLAKGPDVIVATPGRLMHHLSEVEDLSLRSVEYVVFDEADRLFEMGFAEQLRAVLHRIPDERQTLLFSATMPKLLAEFARAGLKDPQLVRLDTDTKISPDLRLEFFCARQGEKLACLLHLLKEVIPAEQQTAVFVSTKHHVELLYEVLQEEGLAVSVVYGAMDQTARNIHMAKFRSQKTKLLVVTDVAARGLDVPLLDNVVNFDFPPKPKLFVHRTGRAARAGRLGTAFSLLTREELPYLLDLHLFLSRPVKAAPTEDEIESSKGEALRASEAAARAGETVFGTVPQPIVDLQVERLRQLHNSNYAVDTLSKVAEKALKLYVKTRPAPSSESIKRAKTFPREGTHLSLRSAVNSVDAAAAAFAEHLRSFRPKQTVLEAEADSLKGQRKAQALDAMRQKRGLHEAVIQHNKSSQRGSTPVRGSLPSGGVDAEGDALRDGEGAGAGDLDLAPSGEGVAEGDGNGAGDGDARSEDATIAARSEKRRRDGGKGDLALASQSKKAKRTRVKPTSFRDEGFFIQDTAPNRHLEMGLAVKSGKQAGGREVTFDATAQQLEQEVLDLIPEDGEGVQKRRASYHWDKKSKKYVKLHAGEKLTASGKIRTESGARVNVNSRGIYQKWKDRTHKSVGGRRGEGEDEGPPPEGPSRFGRGGAGPGRRRQRGAMGATPGNSKGQQNQRFKSELKGPEEIRKQRQQKAMQLQKQKKGYGAKHGSGDKKGFGAKQGKEGFNKGRQGGFKAKQKSAGKGGRGGGFKGKGGNKQGGRK